MNQEFDPSRIFDFPVHEFAQPGYDLWRKLGSPAPKISDDVDPGWRPFLLNPTVVADEHGRVELIAGFHILDIGDRWMEPGRAPQGFGQYKPGDLEAVHVAALAYQWALAAAGHISGQFRSEPGS